MLKIHLKVNLLYYNHILNTKYLNFSGLNVVIILQRRIINQLLTTYLPSILILIIVYLTSFFKPFFFEAVVTVNLTALLVLTTLFISVSGTINGYKFHTLCLKFCHKFYNPDFFVTIHILVIYRIHFAITSFLIWD